MRNKTAIVMSVLLSVFLISMQLLSGCKGSKGPTYTADPTPVPDSAKAAQYYNFILSMRNPATGLYKSIEEEVKASVYENALAAMALLSRGDTAEAEGIFDFYDSKFTGPGFTGFDKNWNSDTGAALETNKWEGDNAFLMIALTYYKSIYGSFGKYSEMAAGLLSWLESRALVYDDDPAVRGVEEGYACIFAAIQPYTGTVSDLALLKTASGFNTWKKYGVTCDHIERDALTFSNIDGFAYVNNYKKTETWQHDNKTPVTALAADNDDLFINVEISAETLLAWKIHKSSLPGIDLSYLEAELEKTRLFRDGGTACSLPYHVTYDPAPGTGHGFPGCYEKPHIVNACYMFFYYTNFNPMAPGTGGHRLNYDYIECENVASQTGTGVKETHTDAVCNTTFQPLQSGDGFAANELTYAISLDKSYGTAKFEARYSDDVAGNTVEVYFDGVKYGQFITEYTGGWETFTWSPAIVMCPAAAGAHTLKLNVLEGTYGVNLDIIKVSGN